MILLLILSLSGGSFEIRQDGTFDSMQECIEHMFWRQQQFDFRRGDVSGACVPQDQVEGVTRQLFGHRA
jgi:hypothetical protein